MELRDRTVDVLKRTAIPLLHRTRQGEALLLAIYLVGEEQSEFPFLSGDLNELPLALRPWAARHREDEQRHAALLRERIFQVTGAPARDWALDPVSRWKLRRFQALARGGGRALGHAWAGHYAVAWREERMVVRVLERHIRALEAGDSSSPSLGLLKRILADERAHVAMCRRMLDALVPPERRPALERLTRKIDRVDRAFGVAGALGLLFTGAWLCVRH
jgi:hypothetical protein